MNSRSKIYKRMTDRPGYFLVRGRLARLMSDEVLVQAIDVLIALLQQRGANTLEKNRRQIRKVKIRLANHKEKRN